MKYAWWVAVGLVVAASALAAEVDYRDDQAPGTAEQVEKGKSLFATCAACHGAEGEGRVGIAPRLNSDSYLAVVSNDFLERTITEGRTGTNMVAWSTMYSDEDIEALVAYVRNWQGRDGIALDESPLKGDVATGEQVFTNICSRCHGRSGAGYAESGSGTGIGRAAFLEQASNGMLRAIIKHGKDNTPMRPFDARSPTAVANLSDEEIDSTILYLRANAW